MRIAGARVVWRAEIRAPGPAYHRRSMVRLRSERDVRHLVDADGGLIAEASVDAVQAERLAGGSGTAQWTEIEVVRADSGAPSVALHGGARLLATAGGVSTWHLTMTHTHDLAEAIAVAL